MVKNTLRFLNNVFDDQLLMLNVSFPTSDQGKHSLDDAIIRAVENVLESNTGDIKLAVISHITSVPAVIYPVKRLTKLFHKHKVQVLVDGAHCLGQIPIDVQDIDSDYYVANGHKWLYSPKGSAILYVRPDRQDIIYPTTISYEGKGSSEFQIGFSYQGTQDMTQFVTMLAALDFRDTISNGNDTAIMDYMHDLAVQGGSLLVRTKYVCVCVCVCISQQFIQYTNDRQKHGTRNCCYLRNPLVRWSMFVFHLPTRH